MIYIDFQGGTHGNFLEFACNTLLAGIKSDGLPFNTLGASHNKKYLAPKLFAADHYFKDPVPLVRNRVISIQLVEDDLLPVSSISLLRAGDHTYDNDQLEINTYNKLNNTTYQWVLDNIIEKFSANQVQNSYEAVKDPEWPDIVTLEDFRNLPGWIRKECMELHNLHLIEISEDHPDCPRWVLREFFKLGFKYPQQAGFIAEQARMEYDSSNNVYYFPFGCFYDLNWFKKELESISLWANLDYNDPTTLHKEFMSRQPYSNDKNICDDILTRIYKEDQFELPHLDLMMESYLTAKLELYYDCEFPVYQPIWFKTSQEILDLIK